MYKIYEKTLKDENNVYGLKVLDEDKNPFLEGPSVLTILALTLNEKNINGSMRQVMEALRLKTSSNENSGLTTDKTPFKVLGLAYSNSKENGAFYNVSENSDETAKFVEKYFYPLVSDSKDKRLSLEEAQRNLRNVNIVSFCKGTETVKHIEQNLESKMKELNYSQEEIDNMLSQICSFPVAEGVIDGKEKVTCVSFKDYQDDDCHFKWDEVDKAALLKVSDNEQIFLIKGDENFKDAEMYHDFKRYTQNNKSLSVALSSALTRAVDNSIKNYNNKEKFSPISCKDVVQDLPKIIKCIEKDASKTEMLKIVDENASYISDFHKMNNSTKNSFLNYLKNNKLDNNKNEIKLNEDDVKLKTDKVKDIEKELER